jgi:hypothetical protein
MAALIMRVRRFADETGSQMVEFALISPLLLLVIAGIADFGFLFQSFEVTTNAAREGARVAVLPGFNADSNGDGTNWDPVENRVADYIDSANLLGTYSTTITPQTIDLGGGTTIQAVEVLVSYTQPMWIIGPIAGLMNGTFQSSITYNTASRMRLEAGASAP